MVGKGITTEDHSNLGRWRDNGWNIAITPRLTDAEWDFFGRRAEECWSDNTHQYDVHRTLTVLNQLFPTKRKAISWPPCTYRSRTEREGKTPIYLVCDGEAQHTDTHAVDVTGAQVAIARCDVHRGLL